MLAVSGVQFLAIHLSLQGSRQQLPDSTEPAEEEQESPALAPGHVWKHLGSIEDSTFNDGPARALPGGKHW